MSRLTCKYDVDNVLRDMCTFDRESNVEADDCLTCHEYCNNKDMNCEHCAIQRAFDKLAEYEDLEEKGLLLKLPCKFGDTYFRILYGEIYENEFNNRATIVSMLDDGAFGKTVFLTKEEAEQGLKRMEGAE